MNKLIVSSLLVLLCAEQANSRPTIRDSYIIENPTTATVYRDSESEIQAWVVPPASGTLEINQRNPVVDEATCKGISFVNKQRTQFLERASLLIEINNTLDLQRAAIAAKLSEEGANLEALVSRMAIIDGIISENIVQISQANRSANNVSYPSTYADYGGSYTFVARTGWEEVIARINAANDGLNVAGIHTERAKFELAMPNSDAFENEEIFLNIGFVESEDSAVVGVTQVSIDVTKIGACFMTFPRLFGVDSDATTFGVQQNFYYPFLISTRVTASYKLSELYKLIVKTEEKRRLFKSKSFRETIESQDLDEALSLEVVFEDPNLTTTQKLEQRTRIKEFLMASAVGEMVSTLGAAAEVNTDTLSAGAEELLPACGKNIKCQGVVAGMKVIGKLFGSSESTTKLERSLEIDKKFNSEERSTIWVPGAIGYAQ